MIKGRDASDRLPAVVSWVLLLLAGALGAAPLVPPAAYTGADTSAFSAARAFDHIQSIAREPHPIGTPAIRRARADIVARLRVLGLEAELQTIEVPDYYGGSPDDGSGDSVSVVNVMARIPGTASRGAVAIVGHYDTAPATPGANDDGSAVAVMLETARALLAGDRLRNDVVLVFTDGEEPAPRFGSSAFVAEHPWATDLEFVINLEALGGGGPSTLIEMNGPARWIIDQYAEAAPHPVAFSYLTATAELIGGSNTDFAVFRDRGIPGLELAYLHGSPIYHTTADRPDRVSLRSLQQHGANVLALTRRIGNLGLGPIPDDTDAVFFTVGRWAVARYPASWTLPLLVLSGMGLVAAGLRQRGWRRIPQSVGATVLTMVGAAVVAAIVWTVLAQRRDTMGVTESYLYLAGLAALTAGMGAAVALLARRRIGSEPDATGVVTVLWGLGLVTAITAPGFSYLFVWPALAGGLALLWRSPRSGNLWRPLAGFLLVTGTALILLVPAIDTFYQLAQPRPGNPDSQILSVIAVPVVFLALVVELVRVFRVRPAERFD